MTSPRHAGEDKRLAGGREVPPTLRQQRFYAQLNEQTRQILLRNCVHRRLKAGPMTTSNVVVLLSGHVGEWVRDASADHDGVAVTLYGPGDIIGLTSAILDDEAPSPATTASVLSTADLATISRKDFSDFANTIGGLFAIQQELARRHRQALNEKSRMRLPTATRLCLFLVDLAQRFGRSHPDGVELAVPLSQSLIADAIGASRTSVEKALSALRARDLVRTGYRTLILVPDFADETTPK
jgi:CRP/FNR family transcriptional regulator, cyclic AMP receptor protein